MSDPDLRSAAREAVPDVVRPPAGRGPAQGRSVTLRALVIVALALAAAGALAWLDVTRDAAALREEAARRLTAAEASVALARSREDWLAGELRDAQAKLALLEARLAESQSQQASIEALYRDLAPSRDDLALAEVEQILLIANQHIALGGNVPAALAALQLAEGKLGRLDRPQVVPLRRAVARDVERLKAVPFTDIGAITQKLDAVLAQVDVLPLARDERLPPAPAEVPPAPLPAWRRHLADAWQELRSLVRLEVSDRPMAPLIAPEQAYFLRENLRLRLLSARASILGRQEASFKADVRAAQAWVRQYFDVRVRTVQQALDALGQMLAAPLPEALPDLGASLDAVRALKATQERRAATPPTTPPRANR
jgi:uroporphyrin-3 C-methyltransferase